MLRYIILLLSFLWIIGCQSDPFINEIEISANTDTPVYAATARWNNQDTLLRVFLSQSIPVSVPSAYAAISNAQVRATTSEEDTYFIYNSDTGYYEAEATLIDTQNYMLDISIGETQLISRQTLPKPLQEVELIGVEDIQTDSSILTNGSLTFKFLDQEGEDNFYIIEMKGEGIDIVQAQPERIEDQFFLGSEEIQVETNVGRRVFFKDNGVDGQNISIDFTYGAPFLSDLSYLEVTLLSMTKEGYDFERTSAEILDASSNPLSEPIILSTNIENGTGVFSLSSIWKTRIER